MRALCENIDSHQYFGSFFEHQPVVGRQERFAFDAVDDQHFCRFAGRNGQLDMGRERSSPMPDQTGFGDFFEDLFFRKIARFYQAVAAVDRVDPNIAFGADRDRGTANAAVSGVASTATTVPDTGA